jgi:hypothetical protein
MLAYNRVPPFALLAIALATYVLGPPVAQAADCSAAGSAISEVYKDEQRANQPGTSDTLATHTRDVELGDRIAVKITNLAGLETEANCRGKGLLVFLNGQPIKGLTLIHTQASNLLSFRLLRTVEARQFWSDLLGSPTEELRKVDVSVGVDGQSPLKADENANTTVNLKLLSDNSFAAALLCFLALLGAFVLLALKTNILRDGSPPPDAVPVINGRLDPRRSASNYGTYSLAKMQGAWWFFVILGAYLLIGIVTWDFYTSISSTAVILLGIGAGTVLGGAIIDKSKDTPEQRDIQAKKTAELKERIEQLNDAQRYSTLQAKALDALAPSPTNHVAPTPAETLELQNLVLRRGPNMPGWLRTTIGPPYLATADIFELAELTSAYVTAAVPPAAPPARLQDLQKGYAGDVVEICELKALRQLNPAPAPGSPAAARLAVLTTKFAQTVPPFSARIPDASAIAIERDVAISRYRKLTNQSEWWFTDILSDAEGVSFHRFQLLSWTIVLGAIFAVGAYRDLAMPVFDTTLMGLLGLSAGTYLGLKIPEPTTPK